MKWYCKVTLAELSGGSSIQKESALAAFLVMPPSPQVELVQLLDEVPALLMGMGLLDLVLFLT